MYTRLTKDVHNTNIGVGNCTAVLFIKILYRLSSLNHSANNAFKFSNAFFNVIVFNKVAGLSVDSTAAVLAVYRLFNFFIKFGETGCSFYTIAEKTLYLDAQALNYVVFSRFVNKHVLLDATLKNYGSSTKKLTALLSMCGADAVFVVDHTIKPKLLSKISRGAYFMFGLCKNREQAFFYDIFLPTGVAPLEFQFFFLELAFFGICLGQKNLLKNETADHLNMLSKLILL